MVSSRSKGVLFILYLCFAFCGYGQSISLDALPSSLKKRYEKAKQYAKNKDYQKALNQFDAILAKSPTFIDGLIAKGSVFQKLNRQKDAAKVYQQAILLNPKYLPRLHYTLGLIELQYNCYEKAEKHFRDYLTFDLDGKRSEAARKYAEISRFRFDAISNPVTFKPSKLPAPLNSEYSEYLPSFTADNVMVFSRRTNAQEDLYYSVFQNGNWEAPIPIQSINTPENEAAHSISANGEWLVFTICNREASLGSCDLFISKKSGSFWSKPVNMGPPVNTKGWEAQPTLSPDGNTLIFASNRQGGYGDYDLWITHRSQNSWTTPKNLGATINTTGKDETPFLHADGKTLYFSSNGHIGMGDADLFVSKWIDTTWSKPINLGYPINTENQEGAMSVTLNGSDAYYASDRNPKGSIPNLDIYTFTLPETVRAQPVTYVKVDLYDKITKQALSGQISVNNLKNDTEFSIEVDIDGPSIQLLPIGTNYAFHASADGYSLYSAHFELDSIQRIKDPFLLSIGLTKITNVISDTTEPIILENIFFEIGSSQLLSTSIPELEYLKKYLGKNPEVKIEIRGHTDNTGTLDINAQLSTDRANAVLEYLVEHGIDENRLSANGYGSSLPLATNETPEGRQKNRRTEFTIIP